MFRALAIALAVMASAPLAHAQAFKPRGSGDPTTAAPKKPAAKPKPAAKKPPPKVAAAKKPAAKSKPVAKRPAAPSEPRPGSPDYVHFTDDE